MTVERPLRLKGIDATRAYTPKEIKALKETAERDESAPPVIRKIHKKGTAPDPLRGLFATTINGKPAVVEYEPDSDLRDTEQVPLLEEGGIEAFIRREVLPHAPDAWYDPESVKTGYEISFTRYFYKPQPLRTLEEIRADILALEKETEGLLGELIDGGVRRDEVGHPRSAGQAPFAEVLHLIQSARKQAYQGVNTELDRPVLAGRRIHQPQAGDDGMGRGGR